VGLRTRRRPRPRGPGAQTPDRFGGGRRSVHGARAPAQAVEAPVAAAGLPGEQHCAESEGLAEVARVEAADVGVDAEVREPGSTAARPAVGGGAASASAATAEVSAASATTAVDRVRRAGATCAEPAGCTVPGLARTTGASCAQRAAAAGVGADAGAAVVVRGAARAATAGVQPAECGTATAATSDEDAVTDVWGRTHLGGASAATGVRGAAVPALPTERRAEPCLLVEVRERVGGAVSGDDVQRGAGGEVECAVEPAADAADGSNGGGQPGAVRSAAALDPHLQRARLVRRHDERLHRAGGDEQLGGHQRLPSTVN